MRTRFRRDVVQAGLLAGIKRDLLSPAAIEEVRRRVVKLAKAEKPVVDSGAAIEKAEAEVANLTDAITTGALRSSPALAARLQAAERELAKLKAAEARPPRGSVEHLMPRLVDEYVLHGTIMTMPGLPRQPSADSIRVNDEGQIEGLF